MNHNKIPDGWKKFKLTSICNTMKAGGTPDSTNKSYYSGAIPFVMIDDITNSGKYIKKTKKHITSEAIDSCNTWLVPCNSLLYTIYASLGEVSINKIPVTTNQAILAIIPKKEKISTEFFYYWLKWYKQFINFYIFQTTQKNLNAKTIKNFELMIPKNIIEQQKIASILQSVDNTIERTKKLINKYKRIKEGLMQDLFTKCSYEDNYISFSDNKYIKLITKGTTPTTYGYSFVEEGINFIKIESIDNSGCINKKKIQFITEDANNYLKRSQLKENDLLFSIAGVIGVCTKVTRNILPANINQALALIRFKEGINVNYVLYILKSFIIQNKIKKINIQLAQKNLNLENIKNFIIPYPSSEKQEKIVNILQSIDKMIVLEKMYLDKLQNIKKGLMQDLFTRKVRVTHLIKEEGTTHA